MSPTRIVPFRVAAGLFASVWSALAPAMGIGPSCLETLAADTRLWSECTAGFDRQDSRCKAQAGRMHATMTRCEAEGSSRADINAAMARGNAAAGTRDGSDPAEQAEPPPQPRPRRGPIPGFEPPPAEDD